ncbi:porin family protein [Spirosoma koreense]
MKNLLPLFALALVPLSLSAQTKPAVRKAAPAKRPVATRPATAAVRKTAPAVNYTAAQPAATAPARQEQPQPVRQEQPVAASPKPQVAAARHTDQPARRVAPASQNNSRFQIGFRLGGNSSTIGGIDMSSYGAGVKAERVTGFHGGVVLNFGGSNFSIQPELLYTQYGARIAGGSEYVQEKYNIVEVPVLLKASFGQPNVRIFVNAGPVGTYTVGGTASYQIDGQTGSQKMDLTGTGRLSFGATGGAGVAIKAGPGSVLVEARYSYLFSSSADGAGIRPQNAMLSAGYMIPVGGR